MSKSFFFISGLPRAGSTLTSALLAQNPDFYASLSSPVMFMMEGMMAQFSAGSEGAALVSHTKRHNLLQGILQNYYADQTQQTIFDTNRGWTSKLDLLMALQPNTKVICLVRDVAWIIDSLERLYRAEVYDNTKLFANQANRSTVYNRADALMSHQGMVGHAWHALREACYSEYADRLLLIDYALLAAKPEEVFKNVYQFLGVPYFEHDFGNVEFSAPNFDNQLGVRQLHAVGGSVSPRNRETILPPELFDKYGNMAFWREMKRSKAFVLCPS